MVTSTGAEIYGIWIWKHCCVWHGHPLCLVCSRVISRQESDIKLEQCAEHNNPRCESTGFKQRSSHGNSIPMDCLLSRKSSWWEITASCNWLWTATWRIWDEELMEHMQFSPGCHIETRVQNLTKALWGYHFHIPVATDILFRANKPLLYPLGVFLSTQSETLEMPWNTFLVDSRPG